ncbi:hypothetical protein [Micromonospora sp. DT231]|uniref:hypothetical protein n=1 Tax=Micromonospora sp. DT231 TaxID=3416526 RepID=UPI003CF4BA2F
MPGLLHLRGHLAGPVPAVELPDGRTFATDDPAGHAAVSQALGRHVTIEPEADVAHHDEGPVSVITTAALLQLALVLREPVDPTRFRANLLIDLPGTGFPEDGWLDPRPAGGSGGDTSAAGTADPLRDDRHGAG